MSGQRATTHRLDMLRARLAAIEPAPGVYLMKDAQGKVIYVGKASSLRNRLRSYFGSQTGMDAKTRELVQHIADFEVIRTDTPTEALILENELIKRYRPRYNIMLRDDKTYPFIRITNEPFPRVIATRRVVQDGSRYFGPYPSAGAVHRTLDLLKRLFPYRACDIEITGNAARPCLYYHIGRCVGPCIGAVSGEEYRQVIDNVVLFLEGRADDVVARLRTEMEAAAERLEFERAARLRDELRAIEQVLQQQKIVTGSDESFDVLAVAQSAGGDACVQIGFVRNGKLLGSEHYLMAGARVDDPPSAILTSFVQQYYAQASSVPPELVLQHPLDESDTIVAFLTERRGEPVRLSVAVEGLRRELVDMIAKSAQQNLEQYRVRWLNDEQRTTLALEELADALGLDRLPRRIECFDVSQLQGTNVVASMVVFEHGKPKKSDYRKFQIKTVEGQDDFAAIREVVLRRYRRALATEQTEAWQTLPDLVLIDGGKGQLNAAREALTALGLDLPIAALAKEHEELYVPGRSEPIVLPRDSQALFLVQRIRDEAHRFAVTFHRSRRTRSTLHSLLDDIPGVGPRRRRELLRRFGSVEGIRQASVEEIAAVPGISRTLAERIKMELGGA
ncbi:excinuclease ABC subunit UvrC [Thermomicrobium sp. 4228-Ro]|uniref:excinuclease ABC subunit UvrC n=1 Tax=Thermomicrobium sp. 4228-Ro TaxID=2993937 RepID=UPI0022499F2F|nr:excinuclease ABC subunit UvrC [Thermomicrobium sp. 4228-Ro]MCX2726441.1 excinuclease ABC subunit UvrC [Thermomicrobium sp. 4228-Ro]